MQKKWFMIEDLNKKKIETEKIRFFLPARSK